MLQLSNRKFVENETYQIHVTPNNGDYASKMSNEWKCP